MIVKRVWTTNKSYTLGNLLHYRGELYRSTSREWVGYFLFGIIPLYIVNTHTHFN